MVYVEFSDATETVVTGEIGGPQPEGSGIFWGEIPDTDPRWIAFINQGVASVVRNTRDTLLRSVYDPGILMAQRALRMSSSPEETTYIEGKIVELDLYAEALLGVPEQPGFPNTIVWPVAPTR